MEMEAFYKESIQGVGHSTTRTLQKLFKDLQA
jgi:hypothetical protein